MLKNQINVGAHYWQGILMVIQDQNWDEDITVCYMSNVFQ